MSKLKAVLVVFSTVAICHAEQISILGTVKDSAGTGIPGAVVKLESANLSTETGTDGSFSLTGSSNAIRHPQYSLPSAACPVRFQNGAMQLSLSKSSRVKVSVHDVRGRQLLCISNVYGAGTHLLPLSVCATGLHLYKISIDRSIFSFKSIPNASFSGISKSASVIGRDGPRAMQARTSAVFRDIISVTREGQIDYMDSILTSDTSGIVITMVPNAGDVTDADGNVYQSVRIGSQVWTVKNLRTTKYNDGTPIAHVTNTSQWNELTTGAYCYYDNEISNGTNHGALYNWYAIEAGKLAPEGWLVPTDEDWTILEQYMIANGYNWDGTTSRNLIAKSMAAKVYWIPESNVSSAGSIISNLSRNNVSGFSALPAGTRSKNGTFYYLLSRSLWWTQSQSAVASAAYVRSLDYYSIGLGRTADYGKGNGFSIRLVRRN